MSVLDFKIEFQDNPPSKTQRKNILCVYVRQFLYRTGLRFRRQDRLCRDNFLEEAESLVAAVRSSIRGSLDKYTGTPLQDSEIQNEDYWQRLQEKDNANLNNLAKALVFRFNRILLEYNFNPATLLYQKPLAEIEEILRTRDESFKKSVEWRRFEKYISQIN